MSKKILAIDGGLNGESKMKIEFDKKKSSEVISNAVSGTVDVGKKAVSSAKSGLATIIEKTKSNAHSRKMK